MVTAKRGPMSKALSLCSAILRVDTHIWTAAIDIVFGSPYTRYPVRIVAERVLERRAAFGASAMCSLSLIIRAGHARLRRVPRAMEVSSSVQLKAKDNSLV